MVQLLSCLSFTGYMYQHGTILHIILHKILGSSRNFSSLQLTSTIAMSIVVPTVVILSLLVGRFEVWVGDVDISQQHLIKGLVVPGPPPRLSPFGRVPRLAFRHTVPPSFSASPSNVWNRLVTPDSCPWQRGVVSMVISGSLRPAGRRLSP